MVLALLCLMYMITYIDRVNISTAAIVFKGELHLSNSDYGAIFAAFGWSYAAFQIIGGWIGDRFGPRRTLGVCGAVWAVSTIFTGLAEGFWGLILARIALGLGEGATFPTATRAMSSWTRAGWRGFAQGITHSFARLGNAVAPPIVFAITAALNWRASFVILGCVSLVWVAAWVLYFRDKPSDHRGVSAAELAVLPPYRGGGQETAVPWRQLVPRMLPTTIVYFCYGWTLWLYLSWIPLYLQHSHNLNLKSSAFFASAALWPGVIGDTMGGVVSDWVYKLTGNLATARRNVVIGSLLGSLVCLMPIFFADDIAILTICLGAAFFCLELTIGPIWSVPMDIAPKHSGTAAGMMNTGSAIAAIASPWLFGIIIDATGNWNLPFAGSIALLLVGAVLAFWMRPDVTMEAAERMPN
ncbi:MAG TPA: MFS transporter [Stellaceae bacterium]|nr:MFS transporter [Stellaceae bacterium]